MYNLTTSGHGVTFKEFVGSSTTGLVGVLNTIVVPLLVTIAALAFVYGIVNAFFLNAESEEKRAEGRKIALYGIVGFVVIFSAWELVIMLLSTLKLGP